MAKPKSQYVVPTQPMSTSEKAAHFLAHCHSVRPGERIPYREIAQVIHLLPSLPNKTNSKVTSLRISSQHIRRFLADRHDLGMDANEDGVRPLDRVQDIVKITLTRSARELAAKTRRVERDLVLVDKKASQFGASTEDRNLKQFVGRVRSAAGAARRELPSLADVRQVRGLLTDGEDS